MSSVNRNPSFVHSRTMDNQENESESITSLFRLISSSGELVGTALGGALGFISKDPGGAALGAAAGLAYSRIIQIAVDVAQRQLSHREHIRVGAGLTFALGKIKHYLDEGKTLRDDGFFAASENARSSSDEILEGVLLKCKNEYEEKKLRFIGNIYANVAIMPEVPAVAANWLIQKAESLTYRQMCIIALLEQRGQSLNYRGVSYGSEDGDPAFELEYNQLVEMLYIETDPTTGEHNIKGLKRAAKLCYSVMGLEEIPEDDLRQLLQDRFNWAFDKY